MHSLFCYLNRIPTWLYVSWAITFSTITCGYAQETDHSIQTYKTILFLGNSITLHAPAPNIGWNANWGMAASSEDKDFVHQFSKHIEHRQKSRPKLLVRNIADFERSLSQYDIPKHLTELFADKPELIIIAIGENVTDLTTPEKQTDFRDSFHKLLQFAKSHSNATIIVRSCFWANETKDRIMREQSQAADIVFVEIGSLGSDPRNRASAEREFTHAGVAGHPGDRGMAAIADALWMALPNSTNAQ
ncbi:MAG: hypothetical protein RLY14_3179 [Planctomycetota bacterium]|jgi:hypothetical protein